MATLLDKRLGKTLCLQLMLAPRHKYYRHSCLYLALSSNTEGEEGEAVMQERDADASPEVRSVEEEEEEEELEGETEDETEDRESESIEEREDEMASKRTNTVRPVSDKGQTAKKSRPGKKQKKVTRKKTKKRSPPTKRTSH